MAEEAGAEAAEGSSLSENISSSDLDNMQSSDTAMSNAMESGIQTNIEAARAEVVKAREPIVEGMAETAGVSPADITEQNIKEAGNKNTTDPIAKALREKIIEPGMDAAKETVENSQEQNGESGKDLKDSPKTQESLLKKYGPTILKFLLAAALFGFALYELDKIAEEMSGCYRFSTSQPGPQVKIGCSQDTCSCPNISQCGKNNTPCTQANGLQYVWRQYTAIDALCQLPRMIIDPIASGLSDLMKPIKEIAIGVVIIAALLLALYVIFKIVNKKMSSPIINDEHN
jgi:hypothetical protein